MAFTGTPIVKKITDTCWRVTGVTLAGDASGTIGFSDKSVAPEVEIDAPNWQHYSIPVPNVPNIEGGPVTLIEAVEVRVNPTTDVTAAVPISIVKTGTTHKDFVATLHNDTAATVSGVLEIYIHWAGH